MKHGDSLEIKQALARVKDFFPTDKLSLPESEICLIKKTICSYVSEDLRPALEGLSSDIWRHLQELRLRIGQPLMLMLAGKPFFFCGKELVMDWRQSDFLVTEKMLHDTVLLISHHSFYALEQEFQHGFITIPGGHRVGLAGKGVLRDGCLQTMKDISSLNMRLARSLPGVSHHVMPYLFQQGQVQSALFIGPPGCGKTTMLRDVAKNFSEGYGDRCLQVGVIDERSEIGCSFLGIPQLNLGPCTDILSGVPKEIGMELFLRVMGHDVVVTDEISNPADCAAIHDLCGCGVAVIASAHGSSLQGVLARKAFGSFLQTMPFNRYIVLSKRLGVGTVEAVYDRAFQLIEGELQCG